MCAKSRKLKQKRHFQLFPASEPLQFIAMDVLGPLPQTNHGNVFVLVMKDPYPKIIGAISTSKTTARHVANKFLDHWIVLYGIPDHLLMVKDFRS